MDETIAYPIEYPGDIIYLQTGKEHVSEYDGVTWCVDKINNDDTVYLHATPERLAAGEMRKALQAITGAFYGGMEWMGPDTLTAMQLGKDALAKGRGVG